MKIVITWTEVTSLGTNQTLKRINCNSGKGETFSGCLNNRKYCMNKGKNGFELDYGYVNIYEMCIYKGFYSIAYDYYTYKER